MRIFKVGFQLFLLGAAISQTVISMNGDSVVHHDLPPPPYYSVVKPSDNYQQTTEGPPPYYSTSPSDNYQQTTEWPPPYYSTSPSDNYQQTTEWPPPYYSISKDTDGEVLVLSSKDIKHRCSGFGGSRPNKSICKEKSGFLSESIRRLTSDPLKKIYDDHVPRKNPQNSNIKATYVKCGKDDKFTFKINERDFILKLGSNRPTMEGAEHCNAQSVFLNKPYCVIIANCLKYLNLNIQGQTIRLPGEGMKMPFNRNNVSQLHRATIFNTNSNH